MSVSVRPKSSAVGSDGRSAGCAREAAFAPHATRYERSEHQELVLMDSRTAGALAAVGVGLACAALCVLLLAVAKGQQALKSRRLPALSRLDAIALTRRDSPPRQSGGAINNYDGTTTLSDCTLSSNHADDVRPSAAPRPPTRPATTPTAPLSAPSLPKPLR